MLIYTHNFVTWPFKIISVHHCRTELEQIIKFMYNENRTKNMTCNKICVNGTNRNKFWGSLCENRYHSSSVVFMFSSLSGHTIDRAAGSHSGVNTEAMGQREREGQEGVLSHGFLCTGNHVTFNPVRPFPVLQTNPKITDRGCDSADSH